MESPHTPSPETLAEFLRSMEIQPGFSLVEILPTTSSAFREEKSYARHFIGKVVKNGVRVGIVEKGADVAPSFAVDGLVVFDDRDAIELSAYGVMLAYVPHQSIVSYQVKPQEK